jgi:hypothetical protein
MNRVFPSVIFFSLMLTGLPAQPQSTIRDAVILKNGTSVVGTLVASSDDSIRIQTGEGNLLVFHKKDVVARTKETVLSTYIPVEDQKVPLLVIAPTFGKGLNKLYGAGGGVWLEQTLSSGFFLGVHIAYYSGVTRQFSFDVLKLVSVNPLQAVTVHADVSEKTSGLIAFLVAGKDVSWRWGTVFRPYLGFGLANLTSELTYLSAQVPSGENLEGDVPLEGNRFQGYVSGGAMLIVEVSSGVFVQPELRYHYSLVDFGGKPEGMIREQTFVEGGNSGFVILISVGVQLN